MNMPEPSPWVIGAGFDVIDWIAFSIMTVLLLTAWRFTQ